MSAVAVDALPTSSMLLSPNAAFANTLWADTQSRRRSVLRQADRVCVPGDPSCEHSTHFFFSCWGRLTAVMARVPLDSPAACAPAALRPSTAAAAASVTAPEVSSSRRRGRASEERTRQRARGYRCVCALPGVIASRIDWGGSAQAVPRAQAWRQAPCPGRAQCLHGHGWSALWVCLCALDVAAAEYWMVECWLVLGLSDFSSLFSGAPADITRFQGWQSRAS